MVRKVMSELTKVNNPAIIDQLNASTSSDMQKVTDPNILTKLNTAPKRTKFEQFVEDNYDGDTFEEKHTAFKTHFKREKAESQMEEYPVASYIAKGLSSIPFGVGSRMDEFVAKMPGVDEERGKYLTYMFREQVKAVDSLKPKTAMAIDVGTNLAVGAPLAFVGAPALVGLSTAGKIGATLAGSVTAGTVDGALTATGNSKDGEAWKDAKTGGTIGAVTSLALGGGFLAAKPIAKKIIAKFKGKPIKIVAKALKISEDAARVIKAAIDQDDFESVGKILEKGGDESMLADATTMSKLLDTAVEAPFTGDLARKAVDARAANAGKNMNVILDKHLGSPVGIKQAAVDIAKSTQAGRETAYNLAYSKIIDYSSGAGYAIEDVISRIPNNVLKSAIKEANAAMKEKGVKNQQIMKIIGEDGAVTFKELPNVQQLDEIKKALGTISRKEVDNFQRRTAAGNRALNLSTDLGEAVGNAVKSYKKALKLGGDKISDDIALQIGADLLTRKTKFRDLLQFYMKASDTEKEAVKQGLRSHIEETLANVSRTITDPNVDAREAMKIIKDLSSRANREKLKGVLGKKASKELLLEVDKQGIALELRSRIARGAATAGRIATEQEIDKIIPQGGAFKALANLQVGDFMSKAAFFLRSGSEEAAGLRKRGIYKEVAEALTKTRGKKAVEAVAILRKASIDEPLSEAHSEIVATQMTSAVMMSLYGYSSSTRQKLTELF
jgi:hypothetical protein